MCFSRLRLLAFCSSHLCGQGRQSVSQDFLRTPINRLDPSRGGPIDRAGAQGLCCRWQPRWNGNAERDRVSRPDVQRQTRRRDRGTRSADFSAHVAKQSGVNSQVALNSQRRDQGQRHESTGASPPKLVPRPGTRSRIWPPVRFGEHYLSAGRAPGLQLCLRRSSRLIRHAVCPIRSPPLRQADPQRWGVAIRSKRNRAGTMGQGPAPVRSPARHRTASSLAGAFGLGAASRPRAESRPQPGAVLIASRRHAKKTNERSASRRRRRITSVQNHPELARFSRQDRPSTRPTRAGVPAAVCPIDLPFSPTSTRSWQHSFAVRNFFPEDFARDRSDVTVNARAFGGHRATALLISLLVQRPREKKSFIDLAGPKLNIRSGASLGDRLRRSNNGAL